VIFFLTYNEAPSGIFSSQVVDVVKFLNQNSGKRFKLVSFISIRNFINNRKTIKSEFPDAYVFPMVPRMSNWKSNGFLLKLICRVYKPEAIIARSVMAAKLALLMRDSGLCKKVAYDGRGAIASEWREYQVVDDNNLLSHISEYENEVIHKSDFRLSVSNALVALWREKYHYLGNEYVVIPCTLGEGFSTSKITDAAILEKRNELKLAHDDVVFIYSGSLAGWQSFDLTRSFIEPILKHDKKNKIVFFSPSDPSIEKLIGAFPSQVVLKHLDSSKVHEYLIVGDYGLLIRENSETNKVASPVKYAEYLSSGLKVIISANLGDYTTLSHEKNWGYLYTSFDEHQVKPKLSEKLALSAEAIGMFTKRHYLPQYQTLIDHI